MVNASGLEDIAAGSDEMLTLYELARSLGSQVNVADAGDVIAKHLRRLIPSALCVFFLYDDATDELESRHAVGDGASLAWALRIPLGQRLSGWVAANRQTILNSDPILDLGEIARSMTPRLRSCLSTPLITDGQLVGVLSLYSALQDAFTEDHRRIVEVAAKQIAQTLKRAAALDSSVQHDPLTGLPDISQLEQLLENGAKKPVTAPSELALLFIDVTTLKGINTSHGRVVADEAVRHVVRQARSGLRVSDVLFRSKSDEFVAVLNATDDETAATIAATIRQNIQGFPIAIRGGMQLTVQVSVTCVRVPQDGQSLMALTTAARSRTMADNQLHGGGSIH
jgi:diguanylate cyclase (GGDEF)-like protein